MPASAQDCDSGGEEDSKSSENLPTCHNFYYLNKSTANQTQEKERGV